MSVQIEKTVTDVKRQFSSSPWILIIALVLLFSGELVALTAPVDVFWFVPLHRLLSGVCLIVFLLSGGLRKLFIATSERNFRQVAGAVLYTFVFFAVVVALNVLIRRGELLYVDTTEQKVYTLAPETQELIGSLSHPLIIRGFFLGGKIENPLLRDLLNRIERSSELVRVEFIDPEKQLPLLEQYGISSSNTLHLTYELPSGERTAKIIRQIDEQEIANTLKKITGSRVQTVYYLTGHGEPDLDTRIDPKGYTFLRESIEGENLRVEPLVIGNTGDVPEDAAALIVAAADRAMLPEERLSLAQYLKDGGKAVFLAEPRSTEDIRSLVAPLGIDIRSDVIVDQVNKMFAPGGLGVQPLVTKYGEHPIVEKFDQGVMFSTVSTVRALQSAPRSQAPGVITELAFTSPSSWGETDLSTLFEHAQAALDATDVRGPLSVAVAFEGTSKTEGDDYYGARIVVFGDKDFVSNGNITQLFNRDLFLNALNWTVGEQTSITVRARSLREAVRGITSVEFSQIYLTVGILFPELVLVTGILVWYRRRRS